MIGLLIVIALILGIINSGVLLLMFPESALPATLFLGASTILFTFSALLFIALTQADVFRLKKRFKQWSGDLEQRMERTSEFVSIIAHQLRSPLTAINWALHSLRNGDFGKLTDDQTKIVTRAQTSAQHLIDLTTNLLQLARMEQNRLSFSFTSVEVTELIEHVIQRANLIAQEREIALAFERPGAPLPDIEADREKLEIVFENLIDNALKYTPKYGKVTVTTLRDRLGVRVNVADTGPGISEAVQKRMFEKFYRGHDVQHIKGIGLGLYITKHIVDNHHGIISFKTAPAEGTTFTVSFPLKQPS